MRLGVCNSIFTLNLKNGKGHKLCRNIQIQWGLVTSNFHLSKIKIVFTPWCFLDYQYLWGVKTNSICSLSSLTLLIVFRVRFTSEINILKICFTTFGQMAISMVTNSRGFQFFLQNQGCYPFFSCIASRQSATKWTLQDT